MPEALHCADPLRRLAEVLVSYSTQVRAGELVSLVGPSSAEALLTALFRAVLEAGGQPMVRMMPDVCEELLYRHGNPEQDWPSSVRWSCASWRSPTSCCTSSPR